MELVRKHINVAGKLTFHDNKSTLSYDNDTETFSFSVDGEPILHINKDFSGLIPVPLEIEGIVGITSTQELMVDTGITQLDVNVLEDSYLPLIQRLKDESTNLIDNIIGDFSLSSQNYHYIVTDDNTYINRLVIWIEDSTQMTPNEYGAIGSMLTNGIQLWYDIGSGHVNIGEPVKSNGQWSAITGNTFYFSYGSTTKGLSAKLNFNEIIPGGLKLNTNDEFGITLNDDLSELDYHYFTIEGCVKQ
jgi:hypothetical protein